jgi:hypothetical protein
LAAVRLIRLVVPQMKERHSARDYGDLGARGREPRRYRKANPFAVQ